MKKKMYPIFILLALAIVIAVFFYYRPTIMHALQPNQFSFQYFESLPENKKVSEAQSFISQRFPPGSDLQLAIQEFTKAGAKSYRNIDDNGPNKGEVYYNCYYQTNDLSHGLINVMVMIEWNIIIVPDKDEKKINKIEVNRDLTGP